MKLPKELTTVTKLSKFVALLMFISLPILAFIFGMNYQKIKDSQQTQITIPTPTQQKACTMDAKICPDGSSVGRTGPNCEFSPCPTIIK